MSRYKIQTFGDPALRQHATAVAVFYKKLQSTVDAIAETLSASDDGTALAAPQIGILKRIIVIDYEQEYLELLNLEILDYTGEQIGYEGCLSFPGYHGLVPRFHSVHIKYQIRTVEERDLRRERNMARCIQHKMNRFDGMLYIDRVTEPYFYHTERATKIDLQTILDISKGVQRPFPDAITDLDS